jgi:hypothetical protein
VKLSELSAEPREDLRSFLEDIEKAIRRADDDLPNGIEGADFLALLRGFYNAERTFRDAQIAADRNAVQSRTLKASEVRDRAADIAAYAWAICMRYEQIERRLEDG